MTKELAIDRARRVARIQAKEMAVLIDLHSENPEYPFEYCPANAAGAIFPDSTIVLTIDADGSESEPELEQPELSYEDEA